MSSDLRGDDARDAANKPPPLRMPRRRRGFGVASRGAAPKFVWGWPLALAAIALLLVLAFLSWRS